jgi:hypothetical protein
MASHTITGLFDSRAEAERAVEYLVQHFGLDRKAVRVHAAGADNVGAGTHERRSEDHHGFVQRGDAGGGDHDAFLSTLPEEDRATFAEGMRRGGIMVTAEVPESRLDDAMRAFKENGAVDIEERAQEWRRAGWHG